MLVVFFLLRSCNACKRNKNIALTVNRKKIKSRVLSSRPQISPGSAVHFLTFCKLAYYYFLISIKHCFIPLLRSNLLEITSEVLKEAVKRA